MNDEYELKEIMDGQKCPEHPGGVLVLINSFIEYEEIPDRNGGYDTYQYLVLIYQCMYCGKVFKKRIDWRED